MSSSPKINSILGHKVKTLRMQRKMTREDLAEKIDVSSRFLADVEAGKVGISIATLKKLAMTLGTTADHLLGIVQLEASAYQEIETRIKAVPPQYLPQLARIISAFSETANSKDA